jgi:hypothetical protein
MPEVEVEEDGRGEQDHGVEDHTQGTQAENAELQIAAADRLDQLRGQEGNFECYDDLQHEQVAGTLDHDCLDRGPVRHDRRQRRMLLDAGEKADIGLMKARLHVDREHRDARDDGEKGQEHGAVIGRELGHGAGYDDALR